MENKNQTMAKTGDENPVNRTSKTRMNKPTRLRSIVVRHLEAQNKDVTLGALDALEQDIQTFVKSILHGAEELGLQLNSESFIGDLD